VQLSSTFAKSDGARLLGTASANGYHAFLLAGQISLLICLMPTLWPAKTALKSISRRLKADAAACGHSDGSVVERIIERLRQTSVRTGLVRPLVVVVAVDEVVEFGLLLQEVAAGPA
jgi:hypothetical protein